MKERVFAVALFLLLVGMFVFTMYTESHYTTQMEVVSVEDDVVTVETTRGTQYQYFGDGVNVGDVVKVRMFTNHTDTRIDDEVVKVRLVKA